MQIITQTSGSLNPIPHIPSVIQPLIIKGYNHWYSKAVFGSMLVQSVEFGLFDYFVIHIFPFSEEELELNFERPGFYLLINKVNSLTVKAGTESLQLYERGFQFLHTLDGKLRWIIEKNIEYKIVCIRIHESVKESWKQMYIPWKDFTRQAVGKNCFFDAIQKPLSPKMVQVLREASNDISAPAQQREKMIQILNFCISALHEKPFPHAWKLKEEEVQKIYQARQFITHHLHKDISIEIVARQFEMNERRFRTGFRRIYGVSFFEFLLHLRMERALQLIMYSNIKISKIASMVGYQSKFTFAAAFRKYYKCKPSEKRRQLA